MLDLIGAGAALCVLAAFYCTSQRLIRALSMVASGLFIFYALQLDLTPVLVLHGLLLPLNAWRLTQVRA